MHGSMNIKIRKVSVAHPVTVRFEYNCLSDIPKIITSIHVPKIRLFVRVAEDGYRQQME